MQIVDFVVCDDIRHEIGGKLTLVGVYNDSLTFEVPNPEEMKWPIGMKLGFYVRLLFDAKSPMPTDGASFVFAISQNNKEIAKFEGSIVNKDAGNQLFGIPLIASPLPVQNEGPLKFSIKIMKDDKVLHVATPPFTFGINVCTRTVN